MSVAELLGEQGLEQGAGDQLVAKEGGRSGWLALKLIPGIAVVFIAICGPWISASPAGITVGRPFSRPASSYILGTDFLGHSVVSEVLNGGRLLVIVPLLATLVTTATAGVLGVVSGYLRGTRESAVARFFDVLIAMPPLIILLVLLNGWGSGIPVLVIVVLIVSGPYAWRYARATTLQIVTAGYVEHAEAMGESTLGVIRRELLPNVAGPMMADSSIRLVGSIYLIASASFLGFGPPPPSTDWAQMINSNLTGAALNPWSVVVPILLIVALSTSVMALADSALRRWST